MLSAEITAKRLEEWLAKHGRRFPWRRVKDPYRIMVVEFLLQRTRAETIERVYDEVFRRFPDVESLATAEITDIKDIFSRLGLLYRAMRLINIARDVLKNYGGYIPSTIEELLRLKGIGVYMASAILNFGHGIPTPVVDKNVMRVANRLWGETRESNIRKFIEELYKHSNHRAVAYALIDLGSLICREKPRCSECPLNDVCPKLPLLKEKWRMQRKVIIVGGKVILKEQPVTRICKIK